MESHHQVCMLSLKLVMVFVKHKSVKGISKSIKSDKKFVKRVVRLLRVILSVGKVEFGVCMGGMAVVGGVLAGGLGLGDTTEGLVIIISIISIGIIFVTSKLRIAKRGAVCWRDRCQDKFHQT